MLVFCTRKDIRTPCILPWMPNQQRDELWIRGPGGELACPEGHISKSVKVRPRLKASGPRSLGGIMTRKQDDEALRQHF